LSAPFAQGIGGRRAAPCRHALADRPRVAWRIDALQAAIRSQGDGGEEQTKRGDAQNDRSPVNIEKA
jgi:hypothetical protein